jgi:hypothetical protein
MNTQLVQSLAQVIRSLSPDEQTLLQQQLAPPQSPPQNDRLSQRRAFLQRPIEERRQILAQQAESLLKHYQEDPEWRSLMAGDIIDA